MNLPNDLTAWTYETVLAVVRRYEYEPAQVDFKEVLNPEKGSTDSKKDHLDAIRRTIASMANTDGGYVLFGVVDREKRAPSPEARIVGIPAGGDLRSQIGQKLQVIERPVPFDTHLVPLPSDITRGILIVHVPLSPLRPHLTPRDDYYVFYRRGNGGHAAAMRFMEIREQMLNSEQRQRQLTLLRLELRTYMRLAEMLRQNSATWFVHFDVSIFKSLLASISDLLPPDEVLLEKLYTVATIASGLNDALSAGYTQWTGTPTIAKGIPGVHKLILGNLQKGGEPTLAAFQGVCSDCARELDGLFGPLLARSHGSTPAPEDRANHSEPRAPSGDGE